MFFSKKKCRYCETKNPKINTACSECGMLFDRPLGEGDLGARPAATVDSEYVQGEPETFRVFGQYFSIEDVFGIKGRGVVVTGRVKQPFEIGEQVQIIEFMDGLKRLVAESRISGIEKFDKNLDRAEPGDAVGCLISGLKRDQIDQGEFLVTSADEEKGNVA